MYRRNPSFTTFIGRFKRQGRHDSGCKVGNKGKVKYYQLLLTFFFCYSSYPINLFLNYNEIVYSDIIYLARNLIINNNKKLYNNNSQ